MELVDTHCHLQFEKFRDRENQVLAAAASNGVKKFICVGTTLADSQAATDLAKARKQKKDIWVSVGAHPHEAAQFLSDPHAAKKLKKLGQMHRVVAIGETGLDYYRQISAKDDQQTALRAQVEVGLALGLSFVFHVRDAWQDFWQIFDSYKNLRGVVHSFSSHVGHLDEILSRGLYVGLNGIMTFTEEHNQLQAAKDVPLERLLLETDAPFLTPAPFRGELCEPKHILSIADFLAKLRGENLEELTKATTTNAINLFNLR